MSYSAEILLGRISKINGYDGTVTIKLERQTVGKLKKEEPVFIEIDGRPVPFFISALEDPGTGIMRVRFKYYESYEKMKEFSGCLVFRRGKAKGTRSGLMNRPESLEGFKVIDSTGSLIGTITGIVNNPAHLIARIISPGNKELLIPLHEDLIIRSDLVKKTVTMELPDGLADIN